MKINEFGSSDKLDEGVLNALFGHDLDARLSGALTRKGTTNTLAQNAFIKDFVQDAIASISNGISGKFIDPKKTMATSSPATPPPADTKDGSTPPPAGSPPTSGPTPTPPPTRGPAGPTSSQATIAAAKQFNKGISASQAANADKRKANDQLKASAQAAMAKPAFQQTAADRVAIQKARQAGLVKEHSTYDRLNAVFESIVEATDPAAVDDRPSIGDYVYDWFNQYMSGVNWKSKENQIIPYIKNIEKKYNSVTKAKGPITQLAKVAYALSKAYGTTPRGAQNATNAKTPAPKVTDIDIQDQIDTMAKQNPKVADAMKVWAAKNP